LGLVGFFLKVKIGNGEWGVGSGEWGVGSGEWGVGSGEYGRSIFIPFPEDLSTNTFRCSEF
jgi:hypothetical protein